MVNRLPILFVRLACLLAGALLAFHASAQADAFSVPPAPNAAPDAPVAQNGGTAGASAAALASGASVFAPSVGPGWNLLGNSSDLYLDARAAFGNQSAPVAVVTQNLASVWKWSPIDARWAFYSPQLTDAANAAYAASHGYDMLVSIGPGEGYWVNAINPVSLPAQAGTAIGWTAGNFSGLPSGWNLISTGAGVSPSQFNVQVSAISPSPGAVPTSNFISLWAWDAAAATWYFHAPSLEAAGGLAAVKAYTDSHNLRHFQDYGKTLDIGTGFWVNKAQ